MIIQNEPNPVSIPKEFMSVYDNDLQINTIYPPPNEYDMSTNTYIETRPIVTDFDAQYGMYYGEFANSGFFDGNYTYILAPSVQSFEPDDSSLAQLIQHPMAGFQRYFISTTTNSDTGVVTTAYSTTKSRYALLMLNELFVIQNPNMEMNADYPSTNAINLNGYTHRIKFDFSDNITYSQTFVDRIKQGTGSKATRTYYVYLDHTELKNVFASKADSYTTINLYHRDGTEWS